MASERKVPFAPTDYELKKMLEEALAVGLPTSQKKNKPASDRKLRSATSSLRRVMQRNANDKITKNETARKLRFSVQSYGLLTKPSMAPRAAGELRESPANPATLGLILKEITNLSAKMDQLNKEVQQIKKALNISDNEPCKADAYQDLKLSFSMLKTPSKVVVPETPCGILSKRLKEQLETLKF